MWYNYIATFSVFGYTVCVVGSSGETDIVESSVIDCDQTVDLWPASERFLTF